jgi:hypothetical protein
MGQVDVVASSWVKRFRGLTWLFGRNERVFDVVGGEFRRNDNDSKLCLCHVANLESKSLAVV